MSCNVEKRHCGFKADLRCAVHEGPQRAVASTGGRNTLVFLERWSVENEISPQNLLFLKSARGDLGSLAARGVYEVDWAGV